ncbi:hypothetical protein EDB89DRAFT_1903481 [Lactarius sanguifluus]|nr:hypothetical protein EDB89DRAFT_1903481 [Lactarius sanguifluus]
MEKGSNKGEPDRLKGKACNRWRTGEAINERAGSEGGRFERGNGKVEEEWEGVGDQRASVEIDSELTSIVSGQFGSRESSTQSMDIAKRDKIYIFISVKENSREVDTIANFEGVDEVANRWIQWRSHGWNPEGMDGVPKESRIPVNPEPRMHVPINRGLGCGTALKPSPQTTNCGVFKAPTHILTNKSSIESKNQPFNIQDVLSAMHQYFTRPIGETLKSSYGDCLVTITCPSAWHMTTTLILDKRRTTPLLQRTVNKCLLQRAKPGPVTA